jgi:hypothetical protein
MRYQAQVMNQLAGSVLDQQTRAAVNKRVKLASTILVVGFALMVVHMVVGQCSLNRSIDEAFKQNPQPDVRGDSGWGPPNGR